MKPDCREAALSPGVNSTKSSTRCQLIRPPAWERLVIVSLGHRMEQDINERTPPHPGKHSGAFIVLAPQPDTAFSWHRLLSHATRWKRTMRGGHQTQAGQKTSDRLVLFVSLPPVNQGVVGSRMGRTSTSFELTEAFIPPQTLKKKKSSCLKG